MTEQTVAYTPLKDCTNPVTMDTEMESLQTHLPDLERLLTSLLVKVQLAQGKEPSVMTRAERRRR